MQAFALAVEEQVTHVALSSYELTIFIKRSLDITEKIIYISDPVWANQEQPSAKAYWLTFVLDAQRTLPGTLICH